jgi:hypothetical protein
MSMARDDLSPSGEETLGTVIRRRAELRHTIVDVEQALARPAPGRLQEWAAEVREGLAHLSADLEAHVDVTQAEAGLHEDILAAAPRLANSVERLRREHQEIRDSLVAARDLLEAPEEGDWPTQVRERVTSLLTRLIRHRQRGADLIYEAYQVDVGGET